MVKRMLKEVSENFKNMKNQSEVNNTVSEMKNILEEINSKLYEAENRIASWKTGNREHPIRAAKGRMNF